LEQRIYELLLVGVLFTNKLLEQRAYDLLLVGVLFTNKLLKQPACKHNFYHKYLVKTNPAKAIAAIPPCGSEERDLCFNSLASELKQRICPTIFLYLSQHSF
jgi:hypothetical protein